LTTEEFLMGYRDGLHLLRLIDEEEQYLMTSLCRTTPGYSGVTVSHGPNVNKIPDGIADLDMLRREHEAARAEAGHRMMEVRRVIMLVADTRLRDILAKRYLLDHQMKEIALELGISSGRLSELHRMAVDEVTLILEKNRSDMKQSEEI